MLCRVELLSYFFFIFFLFHLSYFCLFCLLLIPYYVVNKVEYISQLVMVRSTSVSREQFRDGWKTNLFTQAYAPFSELFV